jgi:ParB-like chromosome segregation protein Spo0J
MHRSRTVKAAFEEEIVRVPTASILPLKVVPESVRESAKFRRIARSIAEVGVIEPLIVACAKSERGKYLLLDGHARHAILSAAGETEIACLVANDDEAFTYNKRVNRLATVQEHYMILRALSRGVSEEKLAKGC